MKYYIVLFLLVFSFQYSYAQIDVIGEVDSCYFVKDAQGERVASRRYAEWQCGKLAGVIDCNERLDYDQESDIVYLNNKDMNNADDSGKPFTGSCETCHMNGVLARRITFVNGKTNGIDTAFYKSSCPQVVRSYIQGKESGQWLYYYDSTQYLAWEMNYYLGEKHGKQIYFTKDGDTTKWENYTNGILDGIKRAYYSGSKIKKEVSYKMGVFDGPFIIYNRDGVIIEEINYKNNKKNEECKYFYDDGKPLKIEHWKMGVENGEFKVFFYQGHVQSVENYEKGRLEGWAIIYYPDSKVKSKALFEKGVLIEEHRYDEHGRETYTFGVENTDGAEDDEMPSTKKKKRKKKGKKI